MSVKALILHAAVIVALFLLQFVASDYVVLTLTRIMVLAIYAVGYNILFGYTGLLSLGHAMFFATGLYAASLGVTRLGLGIPEAFLLAVLTGVIVSLVIGLIMRVTQFDRETATAFGIPVNQVYAGVFVAGAALVAIAAVLIVPIQQAHYLMGLDPLLMSFIVVIIGGLGSIKGSVIAAVIIGMADGVISMFFSPTLASIIATLAVALVLVVRPQGLFGVAAR